MILNVNINFRVCLYKSADLGDVYYHNEKEVAAVKTTRITGGLPKAYKAVILATPKSAPENCTYLSLII
jgi:hypothetical protein